jgi:histidinol-phosphatase
MLQNQDWPDLLEAAIHAAREAGKITLRYFQTPSLAVETKSDASPVTIADKSAEEWIIRFIQKEFPDHSILGEEFGEIRRSGPYRWIIDPIDGTKSFIHGVPLYGTMIGIEDLHLKDAVVGVVNFPALNDIMWASRGSGAFWNERPAKVSEISSLSEATLLATDTEHIDERSDAAIFEKLRKETKLFRMWGDCYGHMLVATGRAEIMVDAKMNLWDVAALKPIIEEAGGKLFDWKGTSSLYIMDAIACNGALADGILKKITMIN